MNIKALIGSWFQSCALDIDSQTLKSFQSPIISLQHIKPQLKSYYREQMRKSFEIIFDCSFTCCFMQVERFSWMQTYFCWKNIETYMIKSWIVFSLATLFQETFDRNFTYSLILEYSRNRWTRTRPSTDYVRKTLFTQLTLK